MTSLFAKSPGRWMFAAVVLLCVSSAAGDDAAETRNVSALNLSIASFDPGVPADLSLHRDLQVFPRIREIEAMFLPFVLRDTLVRTGQWGAVRVVPEPDVAAELLVTGTIVRSDGDTLELRIRAVDASGLAWFENNYTGSVVDDYGKRDSESPAAGYQPIYDGIARDLRAARDALDRKALDNIVELSLLRYAHQLAPSAFGDYLVESGDGRYTFNRLPAHNDPMLARIQRIRGVEYIFTDAVDAKFRELHAEIASVYDVWREYRRKSIEYEKEDARRAQATRSVGEPGSYESVRNLYDNYKYDRVTAQEKDRLAVAFDNEVGPTIDAMEARIAELEGWVDQQYAEWNRILEELFEVESGTGGPAS